MKLKILVTSKIVFLLTIPIFFLSGCLGIETGKYRELEVAKWKFDRGAYKEALPTIQKYADLDNPDAQYMLGYMYFYGNGLKVDRKKAAYYLDESGKKGYALALLAKQIIKENNSKNNISIMKPAILEDEMFIKEKPSKKAKIIEVKNAIKNIDDTQLDDSKVLSINSKLFTIQVLSLDSLKDIRSAIDRYGLKKGYYLYKTVRNDKPWYVLISGEFENVASARKKIAQLPSVAQKWKPFVNSFTEVHRQIKIV